MFLFLVPCKVFFRNCDIVVQQVINHLLVVIMQFRVSSLFASKVFNPHINNFGVLEDYSDGGLCRSHPLFSEDPHALQLPIYYDDVEVSNPLGSAATVHKLGISMHFDILMYLYFEADFSC